MKVTLEEMDRHRTKAIKLLVGWAKAYPDVFSLKSPRPLGLRIHKDLSKKHRPHVVRVAMALYCGTREYLEAVSDQGSVRYSLDGSTTPVSPEHRQHAKEVLQGAQGAQKESRPK